MWPPCNVFAAQRLAARDGMDVLLRGVGDNGSVLRWAKKHFLQVPQARSPRSSPRAVTTARLATLPGFFPPAYPQTVTAYWASVRIPTSCCSTRGLQVIIDPPPARAHVWAAQQKEDTGPTTETAHTKCRLLLKLR